MDSLNSILSAISTVVWGPFILIPLLLGTGLWLTIRLGGLQFRALGRATRHVFATDSDDESPEGDISNYQALTTALAATVGVGNIVGVATALSIGGPGALVWIWITGLLGMASKYTEAYLGVRFRTTDSKGEMSGGPQQYLKRGIPGPLGSVLAVFFAIFAICASFGIGNLAQANAVATNMESTFGIAPAATGAILFVLVGSVLLGGIQAIGRITAAFVPLMIIVYVLGGLYVIFSHATEIPAAFAMIFSDAFTESAAGGGFGKGIAEDHGEGCGDLGGMREDHIQAAQYVDDDHQRHECGGYTADGLDAAEEYGSHQDEENGAGGRRGDTEGRFHIGGHGIGLGEVADAKRGADGKDGKEYC